jgi:hypothetical protein
MKGWLEVIKGRIMNRGMKANSPCGFMYIYIKVMFPYSDKQPAHHLRVVRHFTYD